MQRVLPDVARPEAAVTLEHGADLGVHLIAGAASTTNNI